MTSNHHEPCNASVTDGRLNCDRGPPSSRTRVPRGSRVIIRSVPRGPQAPTRRRPRPAGPPPCCRASAMRSGRASRRGNPRRPHVVCRHGPPDPVEGRPVQPAGGAAPATSQIPSSIGIGLAAARSASSWALIPGETSDGQQAQRSYQRLRPSSMTTSSWATSDLAGAIASASLTKAAGPSTNVRRHPGEQNAWVRPSCSGSSPPG